MIRIRGLAYRLAVVAEQHVFQLTCSVYFLRNKKAEVWGDGEGPQIEDLMVQ